MDDIVKHLYNIIEMDRATLAVIAALCAMSAFALKEYMANPVLVIFVYPVLFLSSTLIQYGIILLELYPPRKLDQWLMWTIMASICGNILAIAFVAWMGRLVDGAAPGRRPEAQPDRR